MTSVRTSTARDVRSYEYKYVDSWNQSHTVVSCRLLKSCRGLFIQCLLSLVFYVNKTLFTKTLLTPTISAINQRLELKRVTRYSVPLFREIPNHSDEKNNNSPWEILMGSRFVRYVNCNDTK